VRLGKENAIMMRRTVLAVLLALGLAGMALPPAAADDTAEVEAVAAQFYVALNAMFSGDLSLMKGMWSHDDDVTYMGPDGGFQVGWKQVLAEWEAQAAMKLGGRVEPEDMRITVGTTIAVTHNFERGENMPAAAGQPQAVSIRATNIFRKENGTWKMIAHHADRLPFLAEPDK
jgi:ketosteroid isomerase-like protein